MKKKFVKRNEYPSLQVKDRVIKVATLLKEFPKGCFIETSYRESLFHFDDAPDCFLVSFQDNQKNKKHTCASIVPHTAKWNGPFGQQVSYPLHLLVTEKQFKKNKWDKSFELQ